MYRPTLHKHILHSGDEEALRNGPAAAATHQQQLAQQYSGDNEQLLSPVASPRLSRGGSSLAGLTVQLQRGARVGLTYAGVQAIESLLSGLEGEFTVSQSGRERCVGWVSSLGRQGGDKLSHVHVHVVICPPSLFHPDTNTYHSSILTLAHITLPHTHTNQALSELTHRSHQVLILPMLALTRGWQAALCPQPPSQPLVSLLSGLADRLQQQWLGFSASQLAAVEQYDGRSKMGLQQGGCRGVWGVGG